MNRCGERWFNRIGSLPAEEVWDKTEPAREEFFPATHGPKMPKMHSRAKRYLSRNGLD